jgi:hypothetical protein
MYVESTNDMVVKVESGWSRSRRSKVKTSFIAIMGMELGVDMS